MELLVRLLGLLALLLVGTGLRRTGVLDDARTDRLNALAYYVALPALILVSTYDRSIGDLLSTRLLAGLLVVLFGTALLAWVVHRDRSSRARRSVAVVQSYHSNLGYLGLPLVAATFGPDVTAIASVVLGVVSLVQLPMTILVFSTINGAGVSIPGELGRLARNPVLASLIVGLAAGSIGVAVPTPVAAGLDVIGTFALPLALLCVGASLRVGSRVPDLGATGSIVALKVCCMPALAWGVFSVLPVDAATFAAGVVMLGTPTAVSTYVFASELGGDREFASLNVFVTTLVSIGTLFALVALVG